MSLRKTAPLMAVVCSMMLFQGNIPAAQTTATAGLRVQLDRDGNRVQKTLDKGPVHGTAPDRATVIRSINTPNLTSPSVVRTSTAGGTVVRLNGKFRAASRVRIDSNGKLHGDCHIDAGHGEAAH